ncbi:ly6/PLAUR domain-containing protein 2-like [Oncorhynchus nerka]|uniref:ly6/PLAUR domain-containing protein 2-like n=1 Tax=Oncorhynchus nerka TaxID=8023 RepID=UPI0011312858|nr:ly6/PLAUR domain-containing protein 2-like [Oncorhynchus nerka]
MGRSFFRECPSVPTCQKCCHHGAMEIITVLLLLSFCGPFSDALKCYVCSSTTTNDACNQSSQTCQAPLDTCMTTVDTFGKIKAIGKYCASARTCQGAASGASVDANGNGNQVTCCSSNLCNINGATGVGLSTLLTLAVCFSHAVLSILWLL